MSIIAGALERKVWITSFNERTMYPNLYVLLIGGPGIGKTDAIRDAVDYWDKLPDVHVAPSSVSRASLADALNDAERNILRPQDGTFTKFNSLNAAVTEFGTFLTAYEGDFMSHLNDLWDCVKYTERKRSMAKQIAIPNPQLNLLAGTTPGWLGSTLPDHAWSEGFASRLMLVYSGERILVDPWGKKRTDATRGDALDHDLKLIHAMYGEFDFEPEVMEIYRNWYYEGCPPVPEHPKLEHYIPRRHTHLLRMMMVLSAARSGELVIRVEDFQSALDLLVETESLMPDVFKSMRSTSDANVIDEAFAFIWSLFAKEQKAIPQHRIIHFLSQRIPAHSVAKLLEVMVQSNMLVQINLGGVGGRPEYRPTPRAQHNS